MIADDFDERTLANMEVALDRASQRFPREFADHAPRKRVAAKILQAAARGERTLKEFTHVALAAAKALTSKKIRIPVRGRPAQNTQHLDQSA